MRLMSLDYLIHLGVINFPLFFLTSGEKQYMKYSVYMKNKKRNWAYDFGFTIPSET